MRQAAFGLVAALWLWAANLADAALPDTVESVKPSIVAIGTYLPTRNPAFRFYGTGFVVGDGRLVATNAHVLQAPMDQRTLERWAIAIPLNETGAGRVEVRGVEVAARDSQHDLAVLRQRGAPLPALTLAAQDEPVREGDEVSFTGYPIGTVLGLFPVTHRALVSALSPIAIPRPTAQTLNARDIRLLDDDPWRVIQLDATAYPGSSGSPLYHPMSGKVVGIINMVFVKSSRESALTDPSGITFAIPVRHLRVLLDKLNHNRRTPAGVATPK